VDIILPKIRKHFFDIQSWRINDIVDNLGMLIRNNLLPQNLGGQDNNIYQATRRGKLDNKLTIWQELNKVFTIQPLQQGGGIGDNYITSALKTQKVNTLSIGQILPPEKITDDYINSIIKPQFLSIYPNETVQTFVDNQVIRGYVNILYNKASERRLQEPLFTNYIKTGFSQLIAQYFDNHLIIDNNIDINRYIENNVDITQFIINDEDETQRYEYTPRGSIYYDIENYSFTVVDDYIINSSHQTSIINILQGQVPPLPGRIPAALPGDQYQFVRKNIPFFVYRFLLYYLDLILQRIQKLPEDIPNNGYRIDYTNLDKFIFNDDPRNPESNYELVEQILPEGEVVIDNDNTFIRQNGDVVVKIGQLGETPVYIIMDSDTEEVKLEKNKINYELNCFHPNVYLGNQFGQEGGIYYFNVLRDNFLYSIEINQMPQNYQLRNNHLFKKDLYNQAKLIQLKYIILYYIYMFHGYGRESQYNIINNITPQFLQLLGDNDVLLYIRDNFLGDIENIRQMLKNHSHAILVKQIYKDETINAIIQHIIDQIHVTLNIPQVIIPAGGAIQRKTRKQRKTHKGVKTRTAKPRKQSPRRHKKRSKKTRKH
jgi:hypothetical protein